MAELAHEMRTIADARDAVIGQTDVGTQLTDSFVSMPQVMLVGINLGYLIMVILFRLLLVFLVIVRALQLAVFGAFVILAVTVHERELSALIVLLLLCDIVVTKPSCCARSRSTRSRPAATCAQR